MNLTVFCRVQRIQFSFIQPQTPIELRLSFCSAAAYSDGSFAAGFVVETLLMQGKTQFQFVATFSKYQVPNTCWTSCFPKAHVIKADDLNLPHKIFSQGSCICSCAADSRCESRGTRSCSCGWWVYSKSFSSTRRSSFPAVALARLNANIKAMAAHSCNVVFKWQWEPSIMHWTDPCANLLKMSSLPLHDESRDGRQRQLNCVHVITKLNFSHATITICKCRVFCQHNGRSCARFQQLFP